MNWWQQKVHVFVSFIKTSSQIFNIKELFNNLLHCLFWMRSDSRWQQRNRIDLALLGQLMQATGFCILHIQVHVQLFIAINNSWDNLMQLVILKMRSNVAQKKALGFVGATNWLMMFQAYTYFEELPCTVCFVSREPNSDHWPSHKASDRWCGVAHVARKMLFLVTCISYHFCTFYNTFHSTWCALSFHTFN